MLMLGSEADMETPDLSGTTSDQGLTIGRAGCARHPRSCRWVHHHPTEFVHIGGTRPGNHVVRTLATSAVTTCDSAPVFAGDVGGCADGGLDQDVGSDGRGRPLLGCAQIAARRPSPRTIGPSRFMHRSGWVSQRQRSTMPGTCLSLVYLAEAGGERQETHFASGSSP